MMADATPECSMCRLDIHGPTATITMDRVDSYNALNIQLISEIIGSHSTIAHGLR